MRVLELPVIGAAARHPVVTCVVAAILATILMNATAQDDLGRAVVYLVVVALAVLFIDLVPSGGARRSASDPVVRGAGHETAVLALSFLLGLAWLTARFYGGYLPPPGLGRLAWLVVLIACVFNALPAVYLLARRYRAADLGLGVRRLPAVVLIVALFAAAGLGLSPGAVTWHAIVQESGGSVWTILQVALLAAVPEEFFRFAWQTRVAAWLRQPATGWLVASLLWAVLHGPKDWDETHSLRATLTGIADIVPLGLLWGYLTYRTQSWLPSAVLHITNIWGLQNLA